MPGKHVCCFAVPWVRIPLSPPVLRIGVVGWKYHTYVYTSTNEFLRLGYAKWGGSGALYLQSAIAELNPQHAAYLCGDCPMHVALIVGS